MTGKCGVNRARGRMTITKIMTIKKKMIKKMIKMVIKMMIIVIIVLFSSIFHAVAVMQYHCN